MQAVLAWTLFWDIPSARGEHVLSLVALSLLSSWSFHRWKIRGLLVPAMLISYSEIQFLGLTFLYYGVITKWFLVPVFAGSLILYSFYFRRIPKYVLGVGLCILLIDFLDGFRISFGFLAGDPYLYDPYTNAKEIMGWSLTSLGAYLDTRSVFSLHRTRVFLDLAEGRGILK